MDVKKDEFEPKRFENEQENLLHGAIGVDLFSRLGGGDDWCPMRGSEATERGEGVGRGIPPPPPPTVGTFSKIRVLNRILGHLKTIF